MPERYTLAQCILDESLSDTWRVECFGEDGECFIALFTGPRAELRAQEYCRWLQGGAGANDD